MDLVKRGLRVGPVVTTFTPHEAACSVPLPRFEPDEGFAVRFPGSVVTGLILDVQ